MPDQATGEALRGRRAVVTGGANGIGAAVALRLADAGATVTIGDIRENPANAQRFAEAGVTFEPCDVRNESDVQRLLQLGAGDDRRLDILVNNAGVGMVKPITEVSEEEWDRCLNTNLKGAFFGCKHAIPLMIAAGGGAIVNMASNAGILPRAHDPVYSTSKLALVGLTKSLALCHAPDRIRVNAVCPGPVEGTEMMETDLAATGDRETAYAAFIQASPLANALGRMIRPQEVAEAVAYLASDAAAMVTGTMLAIDGGKSLGVPPQSRRVTDR